MGSAHCTAQCTPCCEPIDKQQPLADDELQLQNQVASLDLPRDIVTAPQDAQLQMQVPSCQHLTRKDTSDPISLSDPKKAVSGKSMASTLSLKLLDSVLDYEREVDLLEEKALAGIELRLGIHPERARRILKHKSNQQSRKAVNIAKDLPSAVSRITPFAWPWLFFHASILFVATFIFFLFVQHQIILTEPTRELHEDLLPEVPSWVPLIFLPVILFLLPFELRAFRIILPAVFKFAEKPTFLGMHVSLNTWMTLEILQGLVDRFDFATTVITFCRMRNVYGTGIEQILNNVYDIPMHAAVAVAFTFFWVPRILSFITFLPFPNGKNWLDSRGTEPAVKPFSLSEFLLYHIHRPHERPSGGFYNIFGTRVYVLTSMMGIADVSKASLVVSPLERLQNKLEVDRVETDSGTRGQISSLIFLAGVKTTSRVFGTAFWLYIKCCLVTVMGLLLGKDQADKMTLASIVFSTLSFSHATVSDTTSIISKLRLLLPHINKLAPAVIDDATGEILFKAEQESRRTWNKFKAYMGLATHFITSTIAICTVAYSLITLYQGVFTCNVRPWDFDVGCITSTEIAIYE